MQKRSITLQGHRTSLSLEAAFWAALQDAAREEDRPVAAIVSEIDQSRQTGLSSAVRVWLLQRLQQALALAQGNDQQTAKCDARTDDDA